jgi:hypothetical protein
LPLDSPVHELATPSLARLELGDAKHWFARYDDGIELAGTFRGVRQTQVSADGTSITAVTGRYPTRRTTTRYGPAGTLAMRNRLLGPSVRTLVNDQTNA